MLPALSSKGFPFENFYTGYNLIFLSTETERENVCVTSQRKEWKNVRIFFTLYIFVLFLCGSQYQLRLLVLWHQINRTGRGRLFCCLFFFFLQYWGLNSGPSPWVTLPAFLWKVFQDRFSQTICPGWLQTLILLISACWLARIIGVGHQHPTSVVFLYVELHIKSEASHSTVVGPACDVYSVTMNHYPSWRLAWPAEWLKREENLPSKCETLSSNCSTTKKTKSTN
jgi:hypothetical protein